jgi:hypothetical protein
MAPSLPVACPTPLPSARWWRPARRVVLAPARCSSTPVRPRRGPPPRRPPAPVSSPARPRRPRPAPAFPLGPTSPTAACSPAPARPPSCPVLGAAVACGLGAACPRGLARGAAPRPWRPACARPPRVPRRGLELGPACLWHATLSSASVRSAPACARPVRDASTRARVVRAVLWHGSPCPWRARLPPRHARLPPCIPCVVIALFDSINGNSI